MKIIMEANKTYTQYIKQAKKMVISLEKKVHTNPSLLTEDYGTKQYNELEKKVNNEKQLTYKQQAQIMEIAFKVYDISLNSKVNL